MRLSAKLTIVILLSSLLATSIVSFTTFHFTRSALESVISDNQLALARSTMDSLDRTLESYYQDLRNLSSISQNHDSTSLKSISETTGPWQFLAIRSNPSASWQLLTGTLTEQEKNVINQKNFQQHSSTKPDSVIVFAENKNEPLLLFRTFNSNHQEMIGAVPWSKVNEILNQINDTAVFLFDQGKYLLASNQYQLKIRAGIDQMQYPDLNSAFAGKSAIAVGQNLYNTIANYEGNNYQAVLTAVPQRGYKDFTGNGWVLVIEKPAVIVFQSATDQALQLVLLLISFLLIGSGIALFLLRKYIANPIGQLTQVTRSISHGHLSAKAHALAQDEIGELAKNFNTMTHKLNKAYELLDKRFNQIKHKNTALQTYSRNLKILLGKLRTSQYEIAQAKAKVDSMLQSIGDGIVATNANGIIIMINKYATDALGVSEKESVGRAFSEAITVVDEHGNNVPSTKLPIYKVLHSQKAFTTTRYSYRCQDSHLLPVIITTTPIIIKHKIIGALNVFHDLTEERKLDQAKSEFVSLASHQLRMPLSIVNWYTEMLLSGEAGILSNDQKEYLSEIHLSNQRMTNMVNSLLHVSRFESGQLQASFHPTDIVQIINNVITEISPLAKKNNLQINTVLPRNLPTINTDPALLQMLLQNLLSNAAKYTPTGGKIRVKVTKSSSSIVFCVSDNGYGIPETDQKRIFTKLFRASNIKTKDTDGTGLGLYIVKSIVKQLKGKVWFESKEGKGSSFFVQLPCK